MMMMMMICWKRFSGIQFNWRLNQTASFDIAIMLNSSRATQLGGLMSASFRNLVSVIAFSRERCLSSSGGQGSTTFGVLVFVLHQLKEIIPLLCSKYCMEY